MQYKTWNIQQVIPPIKGLHATFWNCDNGVVSIFRRPVVALALREVVEAEESQGYIDLPLGFTDTTGICSYGSEGFFGFADYIENFLGYDDGMTPDTEWLEAAEQEYSIYCKEKELAH